MSGGPIPPDVAELLRSGDKVGAIKRLREMTGLGLKEAKDWVDTYERGGVAPASVYDHPLEGDPNAVIKIKPESKAALERGSLAEAIQDVRDSTGAGLDEARAIVEEIQRSLPEKKKPKVTKPATPTRHLAPGQVAPGAGPGKWLALLAIAALAIIAVMYWTPASAQEGMRVLRDIPYGPAKEQRLDVYLPDPAPANAPVIAMVHGGAWLFGDKSNAQVVVNKSRRWVPKGAIFVSINNRLVPAANPVEQAEDVARAIAFIQKEAKGWGGDPANLVTMGHSAGAHLVALLAADPSRAKRLGAEPWLGTVVLDSGALDVPQIMRNWHAKLFDKAFGGDPTFWKEASPRHALVAGSVPMLVVCSSQRAVSCAQAKQFKFAADQGKGKVTVLEQDLNHREINETLGLDSDYTREVEAFVKSVGLRLK